MRTPLALALFATSVSALHAQPPATPAGQTPAWDVTQARGTTRDIDFTTSEGTWMSVDISPDGAWIVFDLLGHIYRMPAAGGEATALTQNSGVALNFHPRISPDGKLIAFISDRRGQNNLWVMNADGSNQHQVTRLPGASFAPFFTPDGTRIIFASNYRQPESRNFDLYLVNPDGTGLEQVTTNPEFDAFPMFSPDGTKLVWASNRHGAQPHETNIFIADWVARP